MLWAFGSSSVQRVEVCQRDLPRRGVRSVLTFPLAGTGLWLFRHKSLLELSGVPSLTCAPSPGMLQRDGLQHPGPDGLLVWCSPEVTAKRRRRRVSANVLSPLCQCDILPHTCSSKPGGGQEGARECLQGALSALSRLFLPFPVVK